MSSKILGHVWDACAASGIKGTKLMIMARLADYSNDDGLSYPGMKTIARQLGAGESTVRTAVSELEADGWLRRENRRNGNRNTSNLYYLNADRLEEIAIVERSKAREARAKAKAAAYSHPSDSDASDFDPSDSAGSTRFDPSDSGKKPAFDPSESGGHDPSVKTEPSVNSKHESQGIGAFADAPTPTRSAKQDYSPEFEIAWQAYPKRAGGNPKPSAYKAWNARLKDGATPEAMLAGVKRYAAFVAATGKLGSEYVKQAATFFGPDRHFDETWQTPSAPGGVRHTLPPVSGFEGQNYGESGCNW
ncbi:helix-turn-helix domain-containing protein [Serratia marcescens]|uniref:GntR family transcriptional regulator n=1 Tax=Serratia marcescens TaxID=615 RepID=A0A9X8VBH0_SERMA|nr:helix-turn-helix domain-containing protein [Serratia marcescens]MBS3894984.1 helix-turn-helix domain-containing protein [Serratia marcescens]